MKSFFVLSIGRNGPSKLVRVLVLAASRFTRPKKEHRSVRLAGVRNRAMASVMGVSTRGGAGPGPEPRYQSDSLMIFILQLMIFIL